MRKMRLVLIIILLLFAMGVGIGLWMLYGIKTSNPANYSTIGDIPTPLGYERIDNDDAAYSRFLRNMPLKERGSEVMLYTGGRANLQILNYAVVDMPLLSNAEQCADVCMRLRAEYLFNTHQYGRISFNDVNGHAMKYTGGASREAFNGYLRKVYNMASTFSLSREMKQRPLRDMQPSDVFVYAAKDRGKAHKYGHAIMVVDVAVNKKGKKVFLLAEGNTPARNIHVMRNLGHPFRSPWFALDDDADNLLLSVFYYKANELRHF